MIYLKFKSGNYQEQFTDLQSILELFPGYVLRISTPGKLEISHAGQEDELLSDLKDFGFMCIQR